MKTSLGGKPALILCDYSGARNFENFPEIKIISPN